jgi:hypothetical protein
MKVENFRNYNGYQLTYPVEEKCLLKALVEDNQILSEKEIKKMLESCWGV